MSSRNATELQAILIYRIRKNGWILASSQSHEGQFLCPSNVLDPRMKQATQWYAIMLDDAKISIPEFAFEDDPQFTETFLFIGGELEGQSIRVLDGVQQYQTHTSSLYTRWVIDKVPVFILDGMPEQTAKFIYYVLTDRG